MISTTIRNNFLRKAVTLTLLAAFIFSNSAVAAYASTGDNVTPTIAFTTDLTRLGREGRLRESVSFGAEVDRLVDVLRKGGAKQPLIVDETVNPYKRHWWGGVPPGWTQETRTVRSAICMTRASGVCVRRHIA